MDTQKIGFSKEHEMLPVLSRYLPQALDLPRKWEKRLLRELNVRGVRPDLLIACSPDPIGPSHVLSAAHSPVEAAITYATRWNGPLSLDELTRVLFLSRPPAVRALARLTKAGVLSEENGRYGLTSLAELQMGLVAVEAKLSDWRQGLRQANVYLRFAERSLVALDASRIRNLPKVLSGFIGTQIGLALVREDDVEIVLRPTVTAHPRPERYQALARVLRA